MGGSAATETALDNSRSSHNDMMTISETVTLGMTSIKTTCLTGGFRFHGHHVVSPIHTSSHYQSFETPFVYELVGGDRNMEQTNLVVTPDGKTWDEVTRDTSYIGSMSIQINSDIGVVDAGTITIMDECRGYHTDSKYQHHGNKDFAIAYDRQICLRDGEYEFHLGSIVNTAGSQHQVDFRVNGNIVGQFYTSTASWGHGHTSGIVWLKRGDYVQIYGGYWSNGDNNHSEYYIRRLK